MKLMLKVLTIAALCAGFTQVVTPASIKPKKIKMFKTDQKTWTKPWRYGFSDDVNQPTKTQNIKKDVTVSIDPNSANKFLHVCTSRHGASEICGTPLALATGGASDVIAIDGKGNPTFKSLDATKKLIAATKIGKISVYKVGSVAGNTFINGSPWKIKSIDSPEIGNKQAADIVQEIIVKKNPSIAPKLRIPINRKFVINVTKTAASDNKTPTEVVLETPVDIANKVLAIDSNGVATIVDKAAISGRT